MLTGEERAYIAGIIDGEGCIHGVKGDSNKAANLQVCVMMTCKDVVEYLHSVFGGYFSEAFSKRNPKHAPSWMWSIGGTRCREVLETVRPYSKAKKEQIEIALKLVEVLERGSHGTKVGDLDKLLRHKLAEMIRNKAGRASEREVIELVS